MSKIPFSYIVRIAIPEDLKYVAEITNAINESAIERRAPIPLRAQEYIKNKIIKEVAVIAIDSQTNEWIGFCYLEVWHHEKYIANSGLIIPPVHRGKGIAREIKIKAFDVGRTKFPNAQIFSVSTCPAVISTNLKLGYKTISFSDVLNDPSFLIGCDGAVNFINLMKDAATDSKYKAMLFRPKNHVAALPGIGCVELC